MKRLYLERTVDSTGITGTGKTNAEIAREFAFSPGTISTFIARIRYKTGAKNRTELMAVQVDD